ncbi:hypothetical protein RQ479_08285 [Mesorhizobium sp. ISC25]|uniref:hypothetical protein n=1 Tax=Mesorhizobium sp. ISC25 TaxID=3077335 RepID=UPI0035E37BF5
MTQERIVAVAIRHRGLVVTLPAPARHCDVLRPLYDLTKELVALRNQGFLTSNGRFVGRHEAAVVAVKAEQIRDPQWPPELYSEDLW